MHTDPSEVAAIDQPVITIETITPVMAAQMLLCNVSNRPLRAAVAARYASEMSAGRWMLTGEPIIFNGSSLINGQHRLHACISAGVPFQTAVFRHAADGVYAVVDSGFKRQASDALAHFDVHNRTVVAAAARLVIAYRHNAFRDPTRMTELATNQLIVDEVMPDRERYEFAAGAATRARRDGGFNLAATAAMAIILGRRAGHEACDEWMSRATVGADLDAGDPRLALRRWVLGARSQAPVHLSAWIRARNAFVNNEARSHIKPWFKGQPFPTLIEHESEDLGQRRQVLLPAVVMTPNTRPGGNP